MITLKEKIRETKAIKLTFVQISTNRVANTLSKCRLDKMYYVHDKVMAAAQTEENCSTDELKTFLEIFSLMCLLLS